jgi:hypothetical protein
VLSRDISPCHENKVFINNDKVFTLFQFDFQPRERIVLRLCVNLLFLAQLTMQAVAMVIY